MLTGTAPVHVVSNVACVILWDKVTSNMAVQLNVKRLFNCRNVHKKYQMQRYKITSERTKNIFFTCGIQLCVADTNIPVHNREHRLFLMHYDLLWKDKYIS